MGTTKGTKEAKAFFGKIAEGTGCGALFL
jgi:hypothetical protein